MVPAGLEGDCRGALEGFTSAGLEGVGRVVCVFGVEFSGRTSCCLEGAGRIGSCFTGVVGRVS